MPNVRNHLKHTVQLSWLVPLTRHFFSESVEVEKDATASAEDAGVINIRGKNVRRHSAMLRVVADTLKDGGSLQVTLLKRYNTLNGRFFKSKTCSST